MDPIPTLVLITFLATSPVPPGWHGIPYFVFAPEADLPIDKALVGLRRIYVHIARNRARNRAPVDLHLRSTVGLRWEFKTVILLPQARE